MEGAPENRVPGEETILTRQIQAAFLGPKAENVEIFKSFTETTLRNYVMTRQRGPKMIKNDESSFQTKQAIENSYDELLGKLEKCSTPFHSSRYFGHMNWETSIPSMAGHFVGMLFNNNSQLFKSTIYELEIFCIKQLAIMFNLPPMLEHFDESLKQDKHNKSWGHFTSGGTIANNEALWVARNLKYLALSLKKYAESIEKGLSQTIMKLFVTLPAHGKKTFGQLSVWELLNIESSDIFELIQEIFGVVYRKDYSRYQEFEKAVAPFCLASCGFFNLNNWIEEMVEQNPDSKWPRNRVPCPKSFFGATGHYSIAKSASVLGLGQKALQKIEVDLETRINTVKLQAKLNECADNHIPVLSVIGIAGTTEQSTIDNLKEIVAIKGRMANKGLTFHFHIDGAYGGYFATMLRDVQQGHINSLCDYTLEQLQYFSKADSITFDPHKTGYVPYACGGILYKDCRFKNNIILDPSSNFIPLGSNVYGIQDPNSGCSVSSVYLSLEAFPLNRSGHGQLLERTMVNTKIFTASLYGLKDHEFECRLPNEKKVRETFDCCILPRSYVQKHGNLEDYSKQMEIYKRIASTHLPEIPELLKDPSVGKYYYELGPDLNIVCYAMNFIDRETHTWNKSLKRLNKFNEAIERLCRPISSDLNIHSKQLYLSKTDITSKYGSEVIDNYLERYNLDKDDDKIILIRTTIMNPLFTENKDGAPNQVFIKAMSQRSCMALDKLYTTDWN